jgi:hypothetical protein
MWLSYSIEGQGVSEPEAATCQTKIKNITFTEALPVQQLASNKEYVVPHAAVYFFRCWDGCNR